jgi:hypothetical protein
MAMRFSKSNKWVLGLISAGYTGAALHYACILGIFLRAAGLFSLVDSIGSICFFLGGNQMHRFALSTLFYATLNGAFYLAVGGLGWGIINLWRRIMPASLSS